MAIPFATPVEPSDESDIEHISKEDSANRRAATAEKGGMVDGVGIVTYSVNTELNNYVVTMLLLLQCNKNKVLDNGMENPASKSKKKKH
jgi:hypothetical protein